MTFNSTLVRLRLETVSGVEAGPIYFQFYPSAIEAGPSGPPPIVMTFFQFYPSAIEARLRHGGDNLPWIKGFQFYPSAIEAVRA